MKARTLTRLFFRHWDSWVEDKRQHLFVIPADGGEPRDVTPGDRDAYPTSSTFSLGDDFTFSPDSKSLVYTAPPLRDEAWSTNYDICACRLPAARPRISPRPTPRPTAIHVIRRMANGWPIAPRKCRALKPINGS